MNTTRPRRYSAEFKQQAVELALQSESIMQTARDLGIDQSNLRKWVKAHQHPGTTSFP